MSCEWRWRWKHNIGLKLTFKLPSLFYHFPDSIMRDLQFCRLCGWVSHAKAYSSFGKKNPALLHEMIIDITQNRPNVRYGGNHLQHKICFDFVKASSLSWVLELVISKGVPFIQHIFTEIVQINYVLVPQGFNWKHNGLHLWNECMAENHGLHF